MSFSGKTNEQSATVVTNDGWWPDAIVGDFQSRYRMPSEYAETLLVDGLQIGMAWANRQLAGWKASREGEGHETMKAVPCDRLGDESLYLVHYRRAVYSHAKGYLLQQYPTMNRRAEANNAARESETTEDKFYEYAQQAIADFLGVCRVTAVLI